MIRRAYRPVSLLLVTAALLAPAGAVAQYDYGTGYADSGRQGFLVRLDLLLANPRNVDNVVATEVGGSSYSPIIPVWSEDPAGRLELGYAWAGGQSLSASYWTFQAELDETGGASGGSVLAFAIGPPVASGGGYVGDVGAPGSFAVTTEITAEIGDLTWRRRHGMTEDLALIWSLGLRWASFEETQDGQYDEAATAVGANSFDAFKSNRGEMIGATVGVRSEYRIGRFSIGGGLALSILDGELEASSSLDPSGSSNGALPASSARVFDDGRSGMIRDLDLEGAIHLLDDRLRLALGWEQSEWRDIAADLVRNFPGTAVPLRERDNVVFSGLRLGVEVRF